MPEPNHKKKNFNNVRVTHLEVEIMLVIHLEVDLQDSIFLKDLHRIVLANKYMLHMLYMLIWLQLRSLQKCICDYSLVV